MARVILITGGCRSGKSDYARRLAESMPGRRAYIATCPPDVDEEMRARIRRHRAARAAAGWDTIEETIDLARALDAAATHDVVLVDCLTLWVGNLLYEAERRGAAVAEDDVVDRCGQVLAACRARPGTVLFVTNEVGMGVVPASAMARVYRDLVGRSNQTFAAGADAVTLLVCGIPLPLKGK